MPTISTNNVDFHYQRQGSGSPLVLLHGFTGSTRSWADLTDALSSRMDIIAVDLLGHGQTASPEAAHRYAIENAAQDVVAIVKQLGIDRFSLLGYSMGGRLALFLAHRYPETIKALVLESASPGIADSAERERRRQWDYALAESIEQDGVEKFIDGWEQLPIFASQHAVARQRRVSLREQRLQNCALGLANSLRGMGTGSQPSLWESLPAVSIPTLLLCGDLDQKYVRINKQMAGSIRGSELQVVTGAGHNIHFERPHRFYAAVSTFLRRAG